ncbi:uncharacterized protein LOC116343340 isoform X2 [Contarinia nasturtii]|uniref:uncharacterized protein LOC116343340 isoform X2 n=1 Tax=Contarinia nasturtii TaxID=265458 RepID=UPI0012D443E2|nr:uncharacterized protein LOC116343340 isoform X2 [Contarinia nasturtii]
MAEINDREIQIPITETVVAEGIVPYFKKYGEIESMSVTIRYKSPTDITPLLQTPNHLAGRYILRVEKPTDSPTANSVTTSHILDLKEECLEHILDSFNNQDLCSVTETCALFRKLGSKVFAKKYNGEFRIDLNTYCLDGMKQILQLFGGTLKKLTLSWSTGDITYKIKKFMGMAAIYCRDLQELVLYSSCKSHEMDTPCWTVISLTMNFPKLAHLHLECEHVCNLCVISCNRDEDFDGLLENSNISKLTLARFNLGEGFNYIVNKLPHLQAFYYKDYFETSPYNITGIHDLGKLKELRELEIDGYRIPVVKLIDGLAKSGAPIESLKLFGNFDDIADKSVHSICKLKDLAKSLPHLTEFVITIDAFDESESPVDYDITFVAMIKMIRYADRLTKITLRYGNDVEMSKKTLTMANYNKTLNLLKLRQHKLKLLLMVPDDTDLSQLNEKTIQCNREWLEVVKGGV